MWDGPEGPVVIAPLFLLYDYSFLPEGVWTKEEALAVAYETGVVCSDEMVLHPDPFPSREAWCHARVAETEQRLAERDPALPLVLVTHWPLTREPTLVLRYPAVRAVVRHDADARLAPAVQCGHRGVRPPAHPAGDLAGWCPVRGGLGRLPARVAPPRRRAPASRS